MRRAPASPALVVALALAAAPAAAQPAHLDEWTTARTSRFEVHSDAGAARTAEIVGSLESFRAVFAGIAPEVELKSPAPTWIYAFRDADSYAPYRSGPHGSEIKVLGQFSSHRDGNFITLNADPRFLGSFAVVFHEYVHYLVQHNFPRVPRWFNEGLAEYYSTFTVEGDTAVIGRPVERHLRWLTGNAELGLEQVLAEPAEAAGLNEAEKAGRFYAVSWALVHYLLSASEARSAQLGAYLAESGSGGGDPVAAFEDAFDLSVTEMEDLLRRYLVGTGMPAAVVPLPAPAVAVEVGPALPADLLVGLGDLLARMGREREAERHFALARDYEPDHPDARAGLAYVRDRQGRLAEAGVLYREAVALGSTRALTYLLYGRHLLRVLQEGGRGDGGGGPQGLAQEAVGAFFEAVALDPGFAEARAMLGTAHLFGGLDPAAGVPHLRQAWELLPGRTDLLFSLLQAYLRGGRLDAAQALADGEIRALAPPEMVADAREEIERWSLIHSANKALRGGDLEQGLELLDQAISVTSDPLLRARMEERLDSLRRKAAGE